MWLLGALGGLVLGWLLGGVDAALAGALAGGLLGALLQPSQPAGGEKGEQLRRVEAKLDWLYQEQQQMLQRIAKLEGGPAETPGTETPAPDVRPQTPLLAGPPEIPVAAAQAPPGAAVPHRPPGLPPREGAIRRWLFGGNTVVRVGVVILFFGIAFLLRYTYERVQVPIELRLIGVALGGVALLGLGWRLRGARPGYALALQGGGIGVLYLTVFAALRLYALLPAPAALALLAALSAFSAMVAVLQNSMALAVLAASGGFLAPVLASTGSGNHVLLFSYYALLDAGILAIAWYRAWRPLNLLGFAFTFVIGGLWGAQHYRPELYASTQPFLLVFFLMYVAMPVLFAAREAPRLRGYVDATLVFGAPLVAFGLQLALVRDIEYGAAWSALALGAFYLALTAWLRRAAPQRLELLVEGFLALGVAFATLALPLGFDGRWTAAAWALEDAALAWVGVRQSRPLARAFAVLLEFGAGFAFLLDLPRADPLPLLNSAYLGCVLVALAALFTTWYLERNAARVRPGEQWVAVALFVWGALWWAGAGLLQIERHVADEYAAHASLLYLTASWAGLSLLAHASSWRRAAAACLGYTPFALAAAATLLALDSPPHPAARLGFLAWPLALSAHFWLLRRHEPEWSSAAGWLHGAGVWLIALLLGWELQWLAGEAVRGARVWSMIPWALVPAILIAVLAAHGRRLEWPVSRHLRGYLVIGCVPLAAWLVAWTLYATATSDGDPAPLPYLPALNPLDLAIFAAFLLGLNWWLELRRRALFAPDSDERQGLYGLIGIAGFIALNGMLLRALHHLAGIPFALEPMLRSVTVQTAFSVFWTVLALILMAAATRRGLRALWLVGAGLMAVVVGKLFLIDLSNVGGIERIVSFIGVGVLMLVIGYVSPVPPRTREEKP